MYIKIWGEKKRLYNATSAGAVLKLALRFGLRRRVPNTFIISLTTGGGSCFLTEVCLKKKKKKN